MNRLSLRLFLSVVGFGFWAMSLRAEDAKSASPQPGGVRPALLVLPGAWLERLPPDGAVNPPAPLKSVYAGEKIAVALVAEGPGRDERLAQAPLDVQLACGDREFAKLHFSKPSAVRQIKSEGADFVRAILRGVEMGETDRASLDEKTSLVSFAIYVVEQPVPADAEARIRVTGTTSAAAAIPEQTLDVRSPADWLKGPRPDKTQFGNFMTRYHPDLPPGQVMSLLESSVESSALNAPPVATFFAYLFRDNAAARRAALDSFATQRPQMQKVIAMLFRLGGQDAAKLLSPLSSELTATLQRVEPLPDPRPRLKFEDPVRPEVIREMGSTMDRCWAGWMATGDASYLRAIVQLLDGAGDYPALTAWTEAKSGAKGLNPAVARGLAYRIAGWSLSSFQRSDPLVADWLQYWEQDTQTSSTIRKQISTLATNPAFRRN